MTAGILTQMVGMETSNQVREKLQTHYASQTRAQIKKHKQQLRTPKKDRSIFAYLLDIKKIVDQLVVVGCPISTEDHIEVVLDGLSDEYDHPFITSVTSRLDPYTVADIEALLLAQENCIERNNNRLITFCRQMLLLSHILSLITTPVLQIIPHSSAPLLLLNNGFIQSLVLHHPRTSPRCHLILLQPGCNAKFVENMATLLFTVGIDLIVLPNLKLLLILPIFLHLLVMMNLRSSKPQYSS